MNKIYFLSCFILACLVSKGQDYYYTLFASTYLAPKKIGSADMHRVNKTISLTYNRGYCLLYIEGRGGETFKSVNYSVSLLESGTIHESFVSDETKITPFGYYGIMIDKSKDGVSFQVSLPNDFTYFVEKAELYSEDGKVRNNVYIKNYKEVLAHIHSADSLNKVNQEKQIAIDVKKHSDDSLYKIRRDSLQLIAEEVKLNSGNNYNYANLKPIADSVTSKVKTTFFFSATFRVNIDKEGFITSSRPTTELAPAFQKYVPPINDALFKRKTIPFIAQNGKPYPSYSELYISIPPQPEKPVKESKGKVLLRSILNIQH